jgi:hypothetical protein
LNRRNHRDYGDRECPLSFSLFVQPTANFIDDKIVEFCFIGLPTGRSAAQGPLTVTGARPIHRFELSDDGRPKQSPLWCRLDIPDRWTLVGILSDSTDEGPDVAGLELGNLYHEVFETDFTLKDDAILQQMTTHVDDL